MKIEHKFWMILIAIFSLWGWTVTATADKEVAGFRADSVIMPTENLLGYSIDGKWGYYDIRTGEVAIQPQWVAVKPFSPNGLALVQDENDGLYYVNKNGEKVFSLDFQTQNSFTPEGYAVVGNKGEYYYINSHGEIVSQAFCGAEGNTVYDEQEKFYAIDSAGNIHERKRTWGHIYNNERVYKAPERGVGLGLFDMNGDCLISPVWDDVCHFCEGLALVKKDSLYGYINQQESIVIPLQWQQASCFYQGKACVTDGKRLYLINTNGDIIDTSQEMNIRKLCGFYAVVEENDEWYLVNFSGEKVVPYTISMIWEKWDYCEMMLEVEVCGGCHLLFNCLTGAVLGNTYWSEEDLIVFDATQGAYCSMGNGNGYACAYKNGLWYIINKDGTILNCRDYIENEKLAEQYTGVIRWEYPENMQALGLPSYEDYYIDLKLSCNGNYIASINVQNGGPNGYWFGKFNYDNDQIKFTNFPLGALVKTEKGVAFPEEDDRFQRTGYLTKQEVSEGASFCKDLTYDNLKGEWRLADAEASLYFDNNGVLDMQIEGVEVRASYSILDEKTLRIIMELAGKTSTYDLQWKYDALYENNKMVLYSIMDTRQVGETVVSSETFEADTDNPISIFTATPSPAPAVTTVEPTKIPSTYTISKENIMGTWISTDGITLELKEDSTVESEMYYGDTYWWVSEDMLMIEEEYFEDTSVDVYTLTEYGELTDGTLRFVREN